MKAEFDNKVYVVGADHHTTLSVTRCLSHYGCDVHLVIHGTSNIKASKLAHTNSVQSVVGFEEDEDLLINWLCQRKHDKKAFIIPTSDYAALIIDKNAERLNEFYLPGFRGEPGKMAMLMDKFEQKKYADMHGVPMAQSWVIEQNADIPVDIKYPCIVKPLRSAYGSKSSIFVAQDKAELQDGLERMAGPVIIQQYLKKTYELCAYGVMENEKPNYRGGLIRKIHESENGSTVYAETIEYNEFSEKVCNMLWEDGYRGLYDFEILVCEDGLYLNEINFRNSGNGYALEAHGIPAALIWCNSVLGISNSLFAVSMKPGRRHINDYFEIVNIKRLKLGLFEVIRNIVSAHGRAIWDWHDLRGSVAFYKPLINNVAKKLLRKG